MKIVAILTLALLLGGCSGRAIVKPRSEVVEENLEAGLPVRTVDEDRALFYQAEEVQKQRLLTLIRQRSSGVVRDGSYRLGPGDEIELNVFDVPELNVTTRVRQSGFVSLPLVGAVRAGGLTESEFTEDLGKRLSAYVRSPQISMFITQFGSQKIAVMGAVAKPGTYPLRKGINSILELLSEAGGVTYKAGNFLNFIPAEMSGIAEGDQHESRARLTLAASDATTAVGGGIQVYLDQVLGTSGGIPLEIPVRGGDMIIIPEAGKVMVEGEVEKPGGIDLGQQLTVLGALAAAGGITYGAKVDEIEVIREGGIEDKLRLVLDLGKMASGEDKDVRLRNGDIVRVPSDSGRRLTQDTFEGLTKLINFGVGGSVNLAK